MKVSLQGAKACTKSRLKAEGKVLLPKEIAAKFGQAVTYDWMKTKGVTPMVIDPLVCYGTIVLANNSTLSSQYATQQGRAYVTKHYPEVNNLVVAFKQAFLPVPVKPEAPKKEGKPAIKQ